MALLARRSILLFAALFAGLFISASAFAAAYSNLIVFGDSLVDAGNVNTIFPGAVPNPPYTAGRFTNGYTFVDHLSQAITGTVSTPSLPGGSNDAYGGHARSPVGPFRDCSSRSVRT